MKPNFHREGNTWFCSELTYPIRVGKGSSIEEAWFEYNKNGYQFIIDKIKIVNLKKDNENKF